MTRPHRCPRLPAHPALLVVGLAGLFAGGCTSHENDFAPACPSLELLRDASEISRFAGPGAHDASQLVLTARIVAVPANCENGEPGHVKATLHVQANVLRGPAARSDSAALPYFVAVMEGPRVLQEQDFTLPVTFRSNADRADATGTDLELTLPVSKTKSAAAYRLFVGFRLSAEELAYNRQHAAPGS
jgi:hypothetical protein